MTIAIGGLLFELTCSACPEQYDVWRGTEKVGYVRLRHSVLYCAAPDIEGQVVYEHQWPKDWDLGGFHDDDDRDAHLAAIAAVLNAE